MSEASIDLGAYRRNLDTLVRAVAPAEVMAVVKADAYGHGLLPIARAAMGGGIRWLGALDVATAMALRAAGIGADTRVFAWHVPIETDVRSILDNDIDLGISTLAQLEQIARAGSSVRARLHLKIDTGLHRNGALPADWPGLVRGALELERAGIAEVYGVWTHIAEASYEEDSAAIARFEEAIALAEGLGARFALRHLAASAAGLAREDSRFDLVRFGAFTYGISPGGGVTATELGLVPVMTLSATTLRASGEIVVPLGYGDGISSVAAGRVRVSVGGAQVEVERVERDRMVLAAHSAPAGSDVVLFGPGTRGEWTLQQWADATGTIGEEIVTRLTSDIRRRYVE